MSRLILIADNQKNEFSKYFCYGAASIFFFHFLINLAMVMGLFPVIGIPLPFVSYGGSSMLSFTILLFVVLKLDESNKSI
jgi:rod shape determining protein RodA